MFRYYENGDGDVMKMAKFMLASVTICNDELVIKIVEINGLGSLTLVTLRNLLALRHWNVAFLRCDVHIIREESFFWLPLSREQWRSSPCNTRWGRRLESILIAQQIQHNCLRTVTPSMEFCDESTGIIFCYHAYFVFFFFFYSRAAVSVVFHLAVLFRFYPLLVVPHLLCYLNK